ncbi:MAG: hypothetical protein J6T22_09770, partial [Bacteroidales bacterium]|nr:hypothetical protein [Bacteroidales bacterium]
AGGRGYTVDEIICRRFSEEEITNGYMTVSSERMKEDLPYFTITFATEFGNIATPPIEWK